MLSSISEKYQSHILSLSLSGSNWGYDQLSLFNPSLPVFHHLSSDESHRLLVAGMMLSHRLLVAGMMLAPQSKCSVPGSFENETLLICIIYIQEKVHQSIQKVDTGLPWRVWCWNSSLVYSFDTKLQISGRMCRMTIPEYLALLQEFCFLQGVDIFRNGNVLNLNCFFGLFIFLSVLSTFNIFVKILFF